MDTSPSTAGKLKFQQESAMNFIHTVVKLRKDRVLFGTFDDRHAVWQGLLDRGVLVRETGPDGWLRVSIGTPAEMAAFREALTSVTAHPREARS